MNIMDSPEYKRYKAQHAINYLGVNPDVITEDKALLIVDGTLWDALFDLRFAFKIVLYEIKAEVLGGKAY